MRTRLTIAVAWLLFPLCTVAAPLSDEQMEQVIEFRHWVHANPELSNQEFNTAARIAEELRALDLEVRTEIAITGVVGILDTGRPGPVVAVRADMDALPVEDRSGLPFASTVTAEYQGNEVPVAHACGHDIHMSVGLGTAKALVNMKDELRGKVMFIFQPAEEGTPPGEEGGASLMLDEGVFDILRPDAIFALHAQPDLDVGEVGFMGGPAFASSDQFNIDLKGKQAHGAWPHRAVDPIVMAAHVIQAFQTIRSRNLDPQEAGVVTVGIINGGQRYNIIPETVELVVGVRSFDDRVRNELERRIRDIARLQAESFGATVTIDYQRSYDATINHKAETDFLRARATAFAGPENVTDLERPFMGSEDFAYMLKACPGSYFFLGTARGKDDKPLHHPAYDFNDDVLPIGTAFWVDVVENFLAPKAGTSAG
jgi:hippurate hydrolase